MKPHPLVPPAEAAWGEHPGQGHSADCKRSRCRRREICNLKEIEVGLTSNGFSIYSVLLKTHNAIYSWSLAQPTKISI